MPIARSMTSTTATMATDAPKFEDDGVVFDESTPAVCADARTGTASSGSSAAKRFRNRAGLMAILPYQSEFGARVSGVRLAGSCPRTRVRGLLCPCEPDGYCSVGDSRLGGSARPVKRMLHRLRQPWASEHDHRDATVP